MSGRCSCPECGTILRIRDRSFAGRHVHCPDCKIELVLSLNDEREFVADRPEQPQQKAAPLKVPVVASTVFSGLLARLGKVFHSPLVMAWALAIGITAFATILMLRPAVRFRPASVPRPESNPEEVVTTENAADLKPTVPREPDEPAATPSVVETPAATQTPGIAAEPPKDPPAPEKVAPPAVAEAPAPVKPAPPVVPEPPKIDIEKSLQQKFLKASTGPPKSRAEMIEMVKEMLPPGAHIQFDTEELGAKNLEGLCNFSLETTTVGGILEAIAESAGWEVVIDQKKTSVLLKSKKGIKVQ